MFKIGDKALTIQAADVSRLGRVVTIRGARTYAEKSSCGNVVMRDFFGYEVLVLGERKFCPEQWLMRLKPDAQLKAKVGADDTAPMGSNVKVTGPAAALSPQVPREP